MNNEENKFIKLTPFKMQVLQNFPFIDADFDALTNYELLCKVVEYLNLTMEDVNILSEKIDEFQHYFDNLDVQEEINNKLDEMAEDGELTDLIKNYVDPIYSQYETEINRRVNNQDIEIENLRVTTQSSLDEFDEKLTNYTSGAPLVATSTSEMTDTSRIYVNTTDGYWYYYDGDSWEQGGVYQSASIITDKTLTESNVPADAKVVGDYVLTNFTNIKSRNLLNYSNLINGYTDLDGTFYNSTTYYTLSSQNKIDVSSYHGKTLYFSQDDTAKNFRFLCAYNSSGEVVESAGASSSNTYTVPNNIDYIIPSIASVSNTLQIEVGKITTHSTYFDKYVPITNKNVKTNDFDSYNKSLKISSLDETKTITTINNKKNFVISFFGKVNTFNGIRIGQGKTTGHGYNIHITTTGISYQSGTTDGSYIQHHLDIKDYIFINIDIQNDRISHIKINTNGGTYTRNVEPWAGDSKEIFVEADTDTIISDAILNYNAKDSKKFIWYFGDSYISYANTRFPYYLEELGYLKNVMMDGYSGANSGNVYPDVSELIGKGYIPKYIIWGLGMNNPDNNSINESWLAYLTLLWDICDQNNIELVLCTIPNTPTVDNKYKNAYIRNCGLRYIDYANAVNTSENGSTWYDGMLSNDNTHPTVDGAKCLASKLIDDFIEITY